MIQHLYWLEPEEKWKSRGYANNLHLYVDYEHECYELRTEMNFPTGSDNEIEVKNKGNLKRYIGCLKRFGFTDKLL